MNEIESIKFKLNPIITSDDGNKYEVIIQIPMALGWIEDVNFIIDSNVYPMEYFKSEDNMAYFNSELNFSVAVNMGNFSDKYKVYSGPNWSMEIIKK